MAASVLDRKEQHTLDAVVHALGVVVGALEAGDAVVAGNAGKVDAAELAAGAVLRVHALCVGQTALVGARAGCVGGEEGMGKLVGSGRENWENLQQDTHRHR